MLWIVKIEDEEILLFKNKVIVVLDNDGNFDRMEDTRGNQAYSEFDFCASEFENITGLKLSYHKPKKLLLTMK